MTLARVIFAAFALVMSCAGCTVHVRPPANVADPVPVHIIDYGRTSALVIPDARGGHLVKYAYGDWDWYALRKTEWWRAFPALLWPTRGALGRAETSKPEDPWTQQVYTITVERSAAARLQEDLDKQFWAKRETLVHTTEVGFEFVHYGHGYWGLHNSNHATANWLRKMDVRVRGAAIWSTWSISPASNR